MTTATTTTAAETTDPQWITPQVRAGLVAGTATQVRIKAGEHAFTIDEPENLGGTDLGATPVEHLLAALGSCQVITFQVWAEKLDIALHAVDVDVSGDIDLRGFFGLTPEARPGYDAIRADVTLTGPEPPERYDELAAAVEEHCPVLDSLRTSVPVQTTVTVA